MIRPALLLAAIFAAALPRAILIAQAGRGSPDVAATGALPPADRARLAEAFRLAEARGDSLWPGWERVPFAVLLVTSDEEFLIRHPRASPEFRRVGYDSLLVSDVFVRKRVFPPTLLATFPAVGGVPTIVVGQAERTGKTSTAWVLTLVHEHFHQLQTADPEYYRRSLALGLSGGDSTGMWMLNYPFPYDSTAAQAGFAAIGRALSVALTAGDESTRQRAVREYVVARRALRSALAPADYRYLSFQLWQEGVARYTEYEVARWAADHFTPSGAFRSLSDYRPFADEASALRAEILRGTSEPALSRDRRVAFYAVGAATALVLDAAAPGWRRRYFEAMFDLDVHVP